MAGKYRPKPFGVIGDEMPQKPMPPENIRYRDDGGWDLGFLLPVLVVVMLLLLSSGCTETPTSAAPSDAVACDLAMATLYEPAPAPTPPAPAPEPDGDTGAIGKQAGGIRGLIDAGTQAAKPSDVRLIPTQVAQCPGGQCPLPSTVRRAPAAATPSSTASERRGFPVLRRLCRRCG